MFYFHAIENHTQVNFIFKMNKRRRITYEVYESRETIIARLKIDDDVNKHYHGIKLCQMKESARAMDISPDILVLGQLTLYEHGNEKYFFA